MSEQQAGPERAQNESKAGKASPATATTAAGQKKPGTPWLRRAGILLLWLLVLGGLAGNFYHAYEQQKAIQVLFNQYNSFAQGLEASNQSLDVQQSQQESLTTQMLELQSIIDQQGGLLERLGNELVSTRLRIDDNGPASNQSILLAEAESLLRTARQRLLVSRDIRSAIALYLSVDNILGQIDDPAVYSVRDILSRELLALRSEPEIDVQGLYLRLGALVDSLDQFDVVNADLSMPRQEAGAPAADDSFFTSMLGKLGEAFVVTQHDEPIQALLSPAQGYMIKQNIRLQLEQARLALLKQEQEAYRVSLQQAIGDIENFLQAQGNRKQVMLQTLEELSARSVVQEIPPVGNTLLALQQLNATVQADSTVGTGEVQ